MRKMKVVTGAFVVAGVLGSASASAQSTSASFVFQVSEIAADFGIMCGTQRFLFPNQPDQGVFCFDGGERSGPRVLLNMNKADRIAIGLNGSVWIIRGNEIVVDVGGQAVTAATLPEPGKAIGFELFGNPVAVRVGSILIAEWNSFIVLMASGNAYHRKLDGSTGWQQITAPPGPFASLSALTDHSARIPELVTRTAEVWDFAVGPGKVGVIDKQPIVGTSFSGVSSPAVGFRCVMHHFDSTAGQPVEAWRRLELNPSTFNLEWADLPNYSRPVTVGNMTLFPNSFDALTNISIDDATGKEIPEEFAGSMVCKPSGFGIFNGSTGVEGFFTGSEGRAYVVHAIPPLQTLSLDIGTWKDPFAKMDFWNRGAIISPPPGAPILLEVDAQGGPVYSVGSGFAEIPAASLPTNRLPMPRARLALDVFVPSTSSWAGGIQFSADVAPNVVSNQFIGYHALDALPKGQWSTIELALPTVIQRALAENHPGALIHTFVNSGPAGLKVRGLRFSGDFPTAQRPPLNLLTPFVASTGLTGFEEAGGWAGASAEVTSVRSTDGSHSVRLNTGGYTEIISRAFSTDELPAVTSRLSLDVFVPSPAPNPYWAGDVQMFVSCPSAGVWSKYLGRADLSNAYANEWNSVELAIDADTQDMLLDSNTCQLSVAINTPQTSLPTAFFVDRLGFQVSTP